MHEEDNKTGKSRTFSLDLGLETRGSKKKISLLPVLNIFTASVESSVDKHLQGTTRM